MYSFPPSHVLFSHVTRTLKTPQGAGEMAQAVKSLPCKPEVLRWDPQTTHKKLGTVECACHPFLGRRDRMIRP